MVQKFNCTQFQKKGNYLENRCTLQRFLCLSIKHFDMLQWTTKPLVSQYYITFSIVTACMVLDKYFANVECSQIVP